MIASWVARSVDIKLIVPDRIEDGISAWRR